MNFADSLEIRGSVTARNIRSPENMPFDALATGVICYKVSSTSGFLFLATEFFVVNILQLKVAKR